MPVRRLINIITFAALTVAAVAIALGAWGTAFQVRWAQYRCFQTVGAEPIDPTRLFGGSPPASVIGGVPPLSESPENQCVVPWPLRNEHLLYAIGGTLVILVGYGHSLARYRKRRS
jgi:hypothetical protein